AVDAIEVVEGVGAGARLQLGRELLVALRIEKVRAGRPALAPESEGVVDVGLHDVLAAALHGIRHAVEGGAADVGVVGETAVRVRGVAGQSLERLERDTELVAVRRAAAVE